MQRVGEIPCARNSLLSGIASGVGVGVIRGLSVRTSLPSSTLPHPHTHTVSLCFTPFTDLGRGLDPLSASHWAVGTFMLVSLGTWSVVSPLLLCIPLALGPSQA
jgi:cytochrome c oxidase assembly protein subunit 20